MPVVLWFRRDLRVHDHPALVAALASGEQLVPCFCIDRRLLEGRHGSGPRTQFLLEALADLDTSLRERGSRLTVLDGTPERAMARLARELGASQVHATADVGPFARRRDQRVGQALAAAGAELRLHPGLFTVDDPHEVRTVAGTGYVAFGPYHRTWLQEPRRAPVAAPRSLPGPPPGLESRGLPTLGELGLTTGLCAPMRGGERIGHASVARFLCGPVLRYGAERGSLGSDGTSALSPYLHFGCVSARALEARLPEGVGADALRRQLAWRDFYAQLLHHQPQNAHLEHQRRYRHAVSWSGDRDGFDAWCRGQTGYPLVDAAMRQLSREGWMPNRARLVTASFLTKHLGVDWRWGERWFMSLLLDGDEASNNGNWQWAASVGVDPEPVSRRVFNPSRQQLRFDPGGDYVRRYVPELVRVPDRFLAEPWRMPVALQRKVHCVVGSDYPAPIVDHRAARNETIARFAGAGHERPSRPGRYRQWP